MDQESDCLLRAKVGGLWSDSMQNCHPSSVHLKCQIAAYTASNSLSKTEYFCPEVFSFLEKNPRGCRLPGDTSYCRAGPTCISMLSTLKPIAPKAWTKGSLSQVMWATSKFSSSAANQAFLRLRPKIAQLDLAWPLLLLL